LLGKEENTSLSLVAINIQSMQDLIVAHIDPVYHNLFHSTSPKPAFERSDFSSALTGPARPKTGRLARLQTDCNSDDSLAARAGQTSKALVKK